MTEEEKQAALKAEQEQAQKELLEKVKSEAKDAIHDVLKDYAKSDEVKNLQDLAEKYTSKEDVEKLQETIKDIGAQLKAAGETKDKGEKVNSVSKSIRDKDEDFKKMSEDQGGNVHMELKAFTTADNFNPDFDTFLEPQFKPGIARTPDTRERFNILNYVTVGRAFSKTISWIEEDTESGAAQFIDECISKPDVSKEWLRSETQVKKLADYTRVCDEVLEYIGWAEQEIRKFLRKLVYIGMQDGILNGDGLGQNPLGIIPQAGLFVAGTKAASVFNANYSDAIMAVVSQINCLGFMATHVFMNCDDIFILQTTKDLNGQYLIERLGGVTLVDCPFLTPGSFLVGDMPLSNVDIFKDIAVDMGLNGEDFRQNAVSMRGEVWFAHSIPSNHTNAFVFDTFANVISLIDKP